MKRMLIAGAFALAAGGQALAADLPQPAPPPQRAPATYVPVVPIYNWSGVYVGVNGGWGFGRTNWTDSAIPAGTTGNFTTSGGFVGGTIGANYQMGVFVAGVEGDGDWSDLNGSSALGCGTIGGVPAGVSCETKAEWLATARVRVGYAFDRILLYATGGGAAADVQAGPTGGPFDSNTKYGWTVGGGLEFGITPFLTGKIEYLFVDLQNGSCVVSCAGAATPISVTFTESLVRAGINYKFSF